MDVHGVKNMKRARAALSDKVALNHLHELAVSQTGCPRDDHVELAAGRGIDLSGHLDCNASECRKGQVDDLLRPAWHYFNRILVAEGSRDSMSLEVLRMTKVEELEMAVASLSEEEYCEFRRWFLERDWEQWDGQIEEDSRAGKLDFLIKEALEAKREGKLKEL